MWAFDNELSIDLDNIDENIMEKVKTDLLIPFLSDNIHSFLQESGKSDTFRLAIPLENIDLSQYPNGDFRGVIYENGRIIGHTRWEKVGTNFVDIIKNLENIAMNMYIANKVNEIENTSKKILEGLYLDRKAKIPSAIEAYRLLNDEQKRDMKIMSENNLKLLQGINELKNQLFEQELIDLNPDKRITDNWGKHDKNESNDEKFNRINFLINYIIYSYRVLIKWNSDLNNNQEDVKMFNDFMNKLEWDKIHEFATGTSPLKDNNGNLYSRCEDYEKLIEITKEIKENKKNDFINLIKHKQFELIFKGGV